MPEAEIAPGLQRWLVWHAAGMIVGASAAAVSRQTAYLVVPALISFLLLWRLRPPMRGTRRRGVGLANGLTVSRLSVVLFATVLIPDLGTVWVTAAFSLNVAVDAIDGAVARRFGESTTFGAVLDREVDALFVLCAYLYCFVVYAIGPLRWVVLLAGLLPYLYRLNVGTRSPPVPVDNKERFAPVLAALNFMLLLGAVALPDHATPILAVSVSVVLVSFGASFRSLNRHAYTSS